MSSAQLNLKIIFSQSGQGIIEVVVTMALATIIILTLVGLSIRTNRSSDFSAASSQASYLANSGIEIIKSLKTINGVNAAGENYMDIEQDPNNCQPTASGGKENWQQFMKFKLLDWSCPLDPALGDHSQTTIQETIDQTVYGIPGVIHDSGTDVPLLGAKLHLAGDWDDDWAINTVVGGRTFRRRVFVADTPTTWCTGADCGKSKCNTNYDPNPNNGDWDDVKQFTVVVSWTDSSGTHKQVQSACITRD